MTAALPAELIRPEIACLPTYNAGLALDRFRDLFGTDCIAKLDSNENPLGAAPGAISVIREAAPEVQRYPDASNSGLRARIARGRDWDADRVIVGNGSEDLIGALFRAVLRPGDHVVTVCPSFGLHEFGALACGARVTKVPFTAGWSFPVSALGAAMAEPTRILILASPSNPAGPAMSEAQLRALLSVTPNDTLIAFDEAYLEYVDPAARIDAPAVLADCRQPWIVLRTFSKAYGLAGIRVGYGITSDAALTGAMLKTRNPFGVNALAVAAAGAALDDPAHLARVVALTTSERSRVSGALRDKGYDLAPSQTNFLFLDTGGPAEKFAGDLRRKGVLIKAWQEEPFCNWARVTIGSAPENDAFLGAVPGR